MRGLLLTALMISLIPGLSRAAEAAARAAPDVCQALNNQILGPRTQNRPLPLLAGNETQGFRRACSVPWARLSPTNAALPVQACFRANLLQVANDSACGKQTGPLWVSTRWVVTSAELAQPNNLLALCQKLETSALAGTRDLAVRCAQQKELKIPAATPRKH